MQAPPAADKMYEFAIALKREEANGILTDEYKAVEATKVELPAAD